MKPENIMMTRDTTTLKIVDFGMATPTQGWDASGLAKTFAGTLSYMAPEILAQQSV